jgi:hypothetical protein
MNSFTVVDEQGAPLVCTLAAGAAVELDFLWSSLAPPADMAAQTFAAHPLDFDAELRSTDPYQVLRSGDGYYHYGVTVINDSPYDAQFLVQGGGF